MNSSAYLISTQSNGTAGYDSQPYFTDGETEMQRSNLTCLSSLGLQKMPAASQAPQCRAAPSLQFPASALCLILQGQIPNACGWAILKRLLSATEVLFLEAPLTPAPVLPLHETWKSVFETSGQYCGARGVTCNPVTYGLVGSWWWMWRWLRSHGWSFQGGHCQWRNSRGDCQVMCSF